MQQALVKVEQLKQEEAARDRTLEGTIDTFRGQQDRKRAADSSMSSSHGGSHHVPNTPFAARQGEPQQMTGLFLCWSCVHDECSALDGLQTGRAAMLLNILSSSMCCLSQANTSALPVLQMHALLFWLFELPELCHVAAGKCRLA